MNLLNLPSLASAVLLTIAAAPLQAQIFADWGVVDAAGGAGVLDGVPFTVSYAFGGGAHLTPAPPTQSNANPFYSDPAFFTPPAPSGTEAFVGGWNLEHLSTAYVDISITFNSPVAGLRMHFSNVDFTIWSFPIGTVTLESGTPDTTFNASTGQLSDGDASDFSASWAESESASGTLLFNGGAPVSSFGWRMIDNPNFNGPVGQPGFFAADGNNWTLAGNAAVPEPSGLVLTGIAGLAGLLRRRRR